VDSHIEEKLKIDPMRKLNGNKSYQVCLDISSRPSLRNINHNSNRNSNSYVFINICI